jgi:hypothetical protein
MPSAVVSDDVAREDQRDLKAGRECGVLRGLGPSIADAVEEHADLPRLDPRNLFCRTACGKAGVKGDPDRANLIREAT